MKINFNNDRKTLFFNENNHHILNPEQADAACAVVFTWIRGADDNQDVYLLFITNDNDLIWLDKEIYKLSDYDYTKEVILATIDGLFPEAEIYNIDANNMIAVSPLYPQEDSHLSLDYLFIKTNY